MRISKEKIKENHDKIVAVASQMFREQGYENVSVADLMARANLTHGGFYNHFDSKSKLFEEALAKGIENTTNYYSGTEVGSLIDAYISRGHRDAPGQGCPVVALGGEVGRFENGTKEIFTDGMAGLLEVLQNGLVSAHVSESEARQLAISLFAQAVGAVVLSRACPNDSALANEFLDFSRSACHQTIEKAAQHS